MAPRKPDWRSRASARRLGFWLQPSPAWPRGSLQSSEHDSLCCKVGMVRPSWGAVATIRDHVYKGATQCLSRGRPLVNDRSWHHRDTPTSPPGEGCDAWGDHPNLIYLFTHILGEIRKHLVRGRLGPEYLLACTSPVLPPPSISKGILSLKKQWQPRGPPFLLFSLDFLLELLRLTAWWDCHLKERFL